MKPLLLALCLPLCACESVRVGLSYQGRYADYQLSRTLEGGKPRWDVLISADGKRIVPPER